jgi:hypothetical protein
VMVVAIDRRLRRGVDRGGVRGGLIVARRHPTPLPRGTLGGPNAPVGGHWVQEWTVDGLNCGGVA